MKRHFTKKEQLQLGLMVLMALSALIYGTWTLAVVPLRKATSQRARTIAALARKNAEAEAAVAAIAANEARIEVINAKIGRIRETYAIRPILGSSYQLGLRGRIDPLAHATGFTVQAMIVQNPGALPRKRPGAPFSLCVAEIRGIASYVQIRDFLAAIEADNPYIHVSSLTIAATPGNVRRHRVTLRLECISAPAEESRL